MPILFLWKPSSFVVALLQESLITGELHVALVDMEPRCHGKRGLEGPPDLSDLYSTCREENLNTLCPALARVPVSSDEISVAEAV